MPPLGRLATPFDPRGRLSARAYRRIVVRACLNAAGLLCLAIWLGALGFRAGAILVFAGNLGVAAHVLAATARRLHDRDRSAVWLAAFCTIEAASFAPIEDAADRYPVAVIVAVAAALGFSVWFFVETFVRAGTPGSGRYGPASGS